MKIGVRFFASCREITGKERLEMDVPANETVSGVLKKVQQNFPGLSLVNVMVAVNQEFAKSDSKLHDGDEVAFIPPVSGG